MADDTTRPEDNATIITLGNTAPIEVVKADDGSEDRVDRSDLGNTTTTVSFPDGWDLNEQLQAVGNLWSYHSDDPPEWVESDDDLLAQVVARNFTSDGHECAVGRPSGWKEG